MARARKTPTRGKQAAKAHGAAQRQSAKPARAKPVGKKPAAKPARAKPVVKKPAKPHVKKPAAKPVARKPAAKKPRAIPTPIAESETSAGRSLTARERSVRTSPVVEILDDPHPIGALRRFLDSIHGPASAQQAQIALGAAQLMLLTIAREHRGGSEVRELVDLMIHRWDDFAERRAGFHAQEFLRNALAAVGVDRERIGKLAALIPTTASAELLFNLACAHAVARDKVAMLRAVEAALDAGGTSVQFRRDEDFAPYVSDPDLGALLSRADVPQIPVDVEPYLAEIRAAIDDVVATLREFGEKVELRPPARLDAILDAERARRISLPNDYRALLAITNGMTLWDREFLGVDDYRDATPLALRAQRYLQESAEHGRTGIEDCVPLACWGQPHDWLLYDPRGTVRGGEPGYVLMLDADERPLADLSEALARLEYLATEILGTN